ncbi:hypothetical protein JS533_007550 [Bifidobacterium amazonense]|uniref:Uncharacterized protein n=1 Tax=Bifidobacterium amazonense TaxID=2809027 RepID=A0ABS9VVZ0_9BIFI|nr:hypothetical protein [Bifidobacterium amazonense]MCH9276124.1 hypothetical protein [Bifidobacterium amazonense]
MKKTAEGVQDALIPDEITPLMLLPLAAKAAKAKSDAGAFRIAVAKMLPLETREAYVRKYKNIDPVTEALYDADEIMQAIIDAASAVDDLMTYPIEARKRIGVHDIRRSLEDPLRGLATTEDVDPDTGEITED